jgi:hypothetical protein
MAFLRYVVNSSASTTGTTINTVFTDISNWVLGNITTTSGFTASVCNTASSEIQGSIPASVYSVTKNSNTVNTNDNEIYITKYHSDWTSYTNATHPSERLYLIWSHSGTYGLRMRVANRSGANMQPYPSTAYYHSAATNTTFLSQAVINRSSILIWLEEDYMAVQVIESNLNDALFMGAFDLPRSEYAEWAFSQDSDFSCSMSIASLMNGTYNNSVVPAASTDYFHVSVHDYYDSTGVNHAYPSNYSLASDFHRGWSPQDNVNHKTIYPSPWMKLDQVPITGGVGHQLVPLFSNAGQGNGASGVYPIAGRLKGIFRTSDNFASSGTQITYGGNTYRVCMMHKCGSSEVDPQSNLNACYLLRVTI